MGGSDEMESRQGGQPPRREYGDEVELIDYLRVLWKYRFWIVGATIFSALAALAISFLLPPVWEVSMVVEPGKYGSDIFETGASRATGKVYAVDTVENLKAKIANGSYDSQVRTISGWPLGKKIGWHVNVQRRSSVIRVTVEVQDRRIGLKALAALVGSLEKEYMKKIEIFRGSLEQEIQKNREDVTKVRKDIVRVENERDANLAKLWEEVEKTKAEITLLRQREGELSREEGDVRRNTELLMAKRNILIERGDVSDDPFALILYTTSLQQNIAYSNQLIGQLNDVKRTIEGKESSVRKAEIERRRIKEDAILRIRQLESDIRKIEATIKALEERKNFAKAIEIIQAPVASYKPVKPRKKLIPIIAGLLGVVVSVFAAFFTEYVVMSSVRSSSRSP